MTAPRRIGPLAVAALAIPAPAAAHLASTGLGPVYDGAWHLLLAPVQLATLAALSLYAGRRGPDASRRSFLVVPAVWLLAWAACPTIPVASGVAMLAAGLLLAADLPLGKLATPALAGTIAAASAAGYDGPLAPADAAGALAALCLVLALAASIALPARRGATIVALRVAGSWTAALGLLLIGWWVHGRAA